MKKKSIKKKKTTKKKSINHLKKIRISLMGIHFIFLGIFLYQIYNYYQYKEENKRLNSLMTEYKKTQEEIKIYEELKNNYTIQLEEQKNINITNKDLQNKINTLNQEINSLQSQIEEINKKIKSIS